MKKEVLWTYVRNVISILFEAVAIRFLLRAVIFGTLAFAIPQGGTVVNGTATITSPNEQTVQINQTSNQAIIDWSSFNIGSQEKTQFIQPSASSVALNRINPQQGASQIYGMLTANGRIILVNQAGIYFGPGARVDVAGIIASTSDITNANFLAGQYSFNGTSPYEGSVINEGSIIARNNGLVALLGTGVSNNGMIQARLGTVVLASGNKFTIDFYGDQLVNFTIDEPASTAGVDQNGKPLKNGVSNTGKILADGGVVIVSARTASGVLNNVINLEGIVEARSISKHNGEIILSGGETGTVRVAGHLNVSSRKHQGGTIKVLGNNIVVESPAVLNANGLTGGGQILIGGNAHGAGPEQNANYSYIAPGAKIYANALANGNGGKVVVWSNEATGFFGNIFAQGGAQAGNGGWVETSGKAYLEVGGGVDANAPLGAAGMWLLDPANVTIAAATLNGSFDNRNPNTFTTSANTATVDVATINASLNGGTSVTILTTPAGTQTGTITVSNAILKSLGLSTPILTLNAAGGITVNNTISATSGGLNVTLIGDSLTLNSAITTNGGNFLSTTQNAITLASSINTSTGTVVINANQDAAGAQSFAMNAGSSIVTTNATPFAVAINVNAAAGGTGTAALRDITTGSGGTITVNTGSSATGGSITMPAGTLNVDTGTISLTTSQAAARAIGTNALNIQMIAGNLTTSAGSGGTFITNTGTSGFNLSGNTGTGGGFTLTSLNSSGITNNGTLTLPGTLTIAAGATQDITLNSPANNIGTLTITSGRNVSLLDTGAIVLGASNISGKLNVTAGGTISQGGILTVAGTPTFTVTAPTSDILLGSFANAFSITPIFTNNGNIRDISLRRTLGGITVPALPNGLRNLTLVYDSAGIALPVMNLTGTLTATANGTITETGALTVAGKPTFTLTAPNSDLLLASFPNAFTTTPVFTSNGNIRDIAIRRSLPTAQVSVLPAGLRNLTYIYDATGIALPVMTLSGNLSVTANGSITQTGVLTIAGTPTFTVTTPNSDISLASQANNLSITPFYTNNGNIRDLLLRNTNSSAVVPILPTGLRNVTLTFDNAAMVIPAATLTGTFTGTALGNILVNGNFTTGGTVSMTANIGTFKVANAATLFTNNSALNITATDLDLSTTGALNSGTANTAITQNTVNGSIGLGNVTGTMSISGSELQRITANNLTLTTASDSQINVNGITATNSANISNRITLTATAGTLGSISFLNNASTFNALTANADNGINVGTNLATNVGSLVLNADTGGGSPGSQILALYANLTAVGSMSLSGGSIVLGAPVNLTATGITFSNDVTGANNLVVNAGTGIARITKAISIANLTITAPTMALNGGSITTTGNQTYNGFIDFGVATTLTGQNITLNSSVTGGGQNLILIGQPGNNNFTFNGSVAVNNITVTGSATGNNALSVIVGSNENWLLSGTNQGSIGNTGITGNFNFSHIQNLTGGNANDSFIFSNGAGVTGVINGSLGNNSFNYGAYTTPVIMNLANNTATGTGGFSNIQSVTGGSAVDIVIGANTTNTWNITSLDAGNIGGTFSFSSIENLTGGNNGNAFVFSNGASISGLINGVNTFSAINTLDYSLYSNPITVLLANLLYSGDTQNNQSAFITHFININNLTGSHASILQLPSNQTTLTFNTATSGLLTGPISLNQFMNFITQNNSDAVVFVANGIYDLATNLLTVNGTPVQMTGFNHNNFSGNISYINGPIPPTPTPILVPPITTTNPKSLVVSVISQAPNSNTIPSTINNGPSSASITINEATATVPQSAVTVVRPSVIEQHPLINAAINEINAETLAEQQTGIAITAIGIPPAGGLNYLSSLTSLAPNSFGNLPILGAVLTATSSQTPISTLPSMRNIPISENGIGYMQKLGEISNRTSFATQPGTGNNSSILMAIASFGLLSIATLLGASAVLLHMSVASTNSFAKTLSETNAENYLKNEMRVGEVITINNASDIVKLLPNGLPKGYHIVATPVPKDSNVVCVLIGPMATRAMFTVTGIAAYMTQEPPSVKIAA